MMWEDDGVRGREGGRKEGRRVKQEWQKMEERKKVSYERQKRRENENRKEECKKIEERKGRIGREEGKERKEKR